MPDIRQFSGEHRWLSNFHPVVIEHEGRLYPSVEHAYQASKIPNAGRAVFLRGSAGDAKRLGRAIKLPEGWGQLRLPLMERLTEKKYPKGTRLAEQLVDTWPALLIEGNYWGDTFWGECKGKGENNLGKILMARRDALR